MTDPGPLRTRTVRALVAVLAVALGVGGVLAAGAYAAARVAGLTDDSGGHGPAAQIAPMAPSRTPSASASTSPAPTAAATPAAAARSHDASPQTAHPTTQTGHEHAHRQAHRRSSHQQQHRTRRHPTRHARHHRHHHHRAATGTVTLHAAQTRVRPMGRVDLGGRCGCGNGTNLVVQRFEHGQWSRFPASTTAYGHRFHTWVMTGRRGANRFRVVVPGGSASNPVTIMVG